MVHRVCLGDKLKALDYNWIALTSAISSGSLTVQTIVVFPAALHSLRNLDKLNEFNRNWLFEEPWGTPHCTAIANHTAKTKCC